MVVKVVLLPLRSSSLKSGLFSHSVLSRTSNYSVLFFMDKTVRVVPFRPNVAEWARQNRSPNTSLLASPVWKICGRGDNTEETGLSFREKGGWRH